MQGRSAGSTKNYLNEKTGLSFLPSLVNEDVAFHSVTEESGIAAYAALTDRLRIAFYEMHFTLLDLITSDDRVVVR